MEAMGASPMKLVVTAGLVVFGGIFGLSVVSSVAIKGVQTVVEGKKVLFRPLLFVCLHFVLHFVFVHSLAS